MTRDDIASELLALTTLRSELEDLRAQLREELARVKVGVTLKRNGQCPACGSRRFLHAPRVLDDSQGNRLEMAILKPSIWKAKTLGTFEAFVCTACGFVEWYARDVAELEEIPKRDEAFKIHDASDEPTKGPYR
jgi:predicted nucleic-acid-binding Zn-ribbon protein